MLELIVITTIPRLRTARSSPRLREKNKAPSHKTKAKMEKALPVQVMSRFGMRSCPSQMSEGPTASLMVTGHPLNKNGNMSKKPFQGIKPKNIIEIRMNPTAAMPILAHLFQSLRMNGRATRTIGVIFNKIASASPISPNHLSLGLNMPTINRVIPSKTRLLI